jgi:hypothetical protein
MITNYINLSLTYYSLQVEYVSFVVIILIIIYFRMPFIINYV